MMKHLIILAVISVTLVLGSVEERKVTVTWNPGCDGEKTTCNRTNPQGSYTNLVHVQLTGSADNVHLIYSDIQSFSIVFARTNLTTELKANWSLLLSDDREERRQGLQFTEVPIEWFAYEVPIIYEFNDVDGNADMSKSNETFNHETKSFVWKKFKLNETENLGWFEGSENNQKGSFKFIVNFPGKEKRDTSLPHLLLNPESTSIEFIVDSIVPKFNFSKLAINLVMLSNHEDIVKESKRSLDDEYTPGTFRLWSVEVKDKSDEVQSYLQWKPIFYFYDPKSLENSTITKEYDLKKNDSFVNGISVSFFNDAVLYPALNISFGLPGNEKDGYYYKGTNYSSFTFAAGFGAPPRDKMSFIVTLVIIVGFGLPAIVVLVGLVVLIYRKIFRSNTSEFSRL